MIIEWLHSGALLFIYPCSRAIIYMWSNFDYGLLFTACQRARMVPPFRVREYIYGGTIVILISHGMLLLCPPISSNINFSVNYCS